VILELEVLLLPVLLEALNAGIQRFRRDLVQADTNEKPECRSLTFGIRFSSVEGISSLGDDRR